MKHPERKPGLRARRGFTLVELLVAVGFTALIMVAVFRLLDVTLEIWRRGEERRTVVEQAGSIGRLFVHDLQSLHAGQQGDLVAEWVDFDTTGDGLRDATWPRIRLVRQASAAELAHLRGPRLDPVASAEEGEEQLLLGPQPLGEAPAGGLIEVAWIAIPHKPELINGALLPEYADRRASAVLLRGERIHDGDSEGSFFAYDYFSQSHEPRAGSVQEVSGGLLWMGMAFATQTTILRAFADEGEGPQGGWTIGPDLRDASASWDAWNRGRPDMNLHPWNEPGAGMPKAKDRPLLPRRVRIEFEFENAKDRKRRTRTSEPINLEMTSFDVENGERVPMKAGRHILIDAEWMRVERVAGDRVYVRRGARGTEKRLHQAGAMVHHGTTVVTEIPIEMYSDDWSL